MTKDPLTYKWSSLGEYFLDESNKTASCHTNFLLSLISSKEYRSFVTDYAEYAQSLASYPELLIDDE